MDDPIERGRFFLSSQKPANETPLSDAVNQLAAGSWRNGPLLSQRLYDNDDDEDDDDDDVA